MTREQAALRPETREPMRESIRTRSRTRKGDEDAFYVEPSVVPDGMSWEWKRKEVFGKPDLRHQQNLIANGWEAVSSDRYPGYMPAGHAGPVENGDMILMERPKELTDEARVEDQQIAHAQVRGQEASLAIPPQGQAPRQHPNLPSPKGMVRKSHAPMEVPE